MMIKYRFYEISAILAIITLTVLAGFSCAKATDTAPLTGVTWTLKSYGDPGKLTAALPDKETTLTFDKEKKEVGGNGGVNGYSGDYTVNGTKLTVRDIMLTLLGGPEPLMNQESTFLTILESAQSYKISGQELTITGTAGILVLLQK
ncbi:MAG: META domain-containing protein [Dehalococcoidales bacterium]|jgi:heat shock protein HslJ